MSYSKDAGSKRIMDLKFCRSIVKKKPIDTIACVALSTQNPAQWGCRKIERERTEKLVGRQKTAQRYIVIYIVFCVLVSDDLLASIWKRMETPPLRHDCLFTIVLIILLLSRSLLFSFLVHSIPRGNDSVKSDTQLLKKYPIQQGVDALESVISSRERETTMPHCFKSTNKLRFGWKSLQPGEITGSSSFDRMTFRRTLIALKPHTYNFGKLES
jgi:hypothetical protein